MPTIKASSTSDQASEIYQTVQLRCELMSAVTDAMQAAPGGAEKPSRPCTCCSTGRPPAGPHSSHRTLCHCRPSWSPSASDPSAHAAAPLPPARRTGCATNNRSSLTLVGYNLLEAAWVLAVACNGMLITHSLVGGQISVATED